MRSTENVAREFESAHKLFPQAKEFFFDDDTFNIRKDRVIELCKKIKHVGHRWSCTARVHSDYETLKAMADAGARLLIVGFESGDPQILKNIKKGATVEMARSFVKNCKKVGINVHGDFILGLPGETKEDDSEDHRLRQGTGLRIDAGFFGARLSGDRALQHFGAERRFCTAKRSPMTAGTSFPHLEYPGLTREMMMSEVHRFYDEYFFRPRVAWRFVRERLWDANDRKRLYPRGRGFYEACVRNGASWRVRGSRRRRSLRCRRLSR